MASSLLSRSCPRVRSLALGTSEFHVRAARPRSSPLQRCQLMSTGRMTPKIVDASMWKSVIPKFLRSRKDAPKTTHRNPAIFYIAMFMLIGSQAIHLLQLRTTHENFLRSTDMKIRQLREVIEKLRSGEEVDVKRALGTGNKASEDEWEEVLREIEQEELEWRSKLGSIQSGEGSEEPMDTSSPKDMTTEQKRPPRFY